MAEKKPVFAAMQLLTRRMKVRTLQVWLLFGARLFCQANRLNLGGLMPLMVAELGLTTAQQGSLMAAFPLGYLLTQVLGGLASDHFGGKPVMALALGSTGVGILAYSRFDNYDQMWGTMLLMGLLQGPSFPTNGVLMSRWVPRAERAFASGVADAGGPVGALVALFVTPVLAAQLGWRATLTISGAVTLLFTLLWQLLASNDPECCGFVAEEELAELRALGVLKAPTPSTAVKDSSNGTKNALDSQRQGGFPVRILVIPSVWSVLLAHSAFNYSRYLMYNWVLTFYTEALKVPVSESGLWMLWPNLADAVTSVGVGLLADALGNSGRLSTVSTRRLFSIVGFMGTGSAAMLLASTTGPAAATTLLVAASSAQGFHNAGFKSSYGDLSREYSGLLTGLGNTLASASSFVVPLLAARMLEANGGPSEVAAWSVVYGSVLVCSLVGSVLYGVLVSSESIDPRLRIAGKGSKED